MIKKIALTYALLSISLLVAQENSPKVVISGEKVLEDLVADWIVRYNQHSKSSIVFEPKAKDAHLHIDFYGEEKARNDMEFFTVGKLAIVPVTNSGSDIASELEKKGLTENRIKALYFDDLLGSSKDADLPKTPYQVYTRLGDSGVPHIFAKAFGENPRNIRGKAIGGNDFHVLQAMERDPLGISFNTLNILYDQQTREPLKAFTIVPLDLDGNGKVTDDERVFGNLDMALQTIRETDKDRNRTGIVIANIRIALQKKVATSQAKDFLKWVVENGQESLTKNGFLKVDPDILEKERPLISELVLNQP